MKPCSLKPRAALRFLVASLSLLLAVHAGEARSQVITTVAGSGDVMNDTGAGTPATTNYIHRPEGLVSDGKGTLYISDSSGLNRIRKVDLATGIMTNYVGGSGTAVVVEGVPAATAYISAPRGLALDTAGNLYIADANNNRIRRVDAATGLIYTVAGDGNRAHAGDGGPATAASLNEPNGVAVDAAGNVYIADRTGGRIRKVDAVTKVITTVAGNGTQDYAGDGGPATAASLNFPTGLAVDAAGNIYIADTNNDRVRFVSAATGVIVTVAGKTPFGFSGDGGPATNAQLSLPWGVALDKDGNLYIADRNNMRIRRVTAATGIIATVAGNGDFGFAGDGGSATAATLYAPFAIAVDSAGVAFIADTNNSRVRAFTPSGVVGGGGLLTLNPVALDFAGQSMRTTSFEKAVSILNGGTASVAVSSVTVSPSFNASHDCAVLNPGMSCQALVSFTPTLEGVIKGTLDITAGGLTQTVALTGNGEKSLVTHFYRAVLRRDPDAGGKAFWDSEATRVQALGLNVNEVWYAIAVSFYRSPEYLAMNRDNAGYVTDLFNTFFNRVPDPAGLVYWKGQLDQGLPREVALAAFMFSAEFSNFNQAIFGVTVTRKEIDTLADLFRGLVGTLPENTLFQHWLGVFRTAQCQGVPAVNAQVESLSSAFANGAQYDSRGRDTSQYVGDLDNAFLRRGGDLDGVLYWINQITTGAMSRDQVRRAFLGSPEFQGRVAAIVAQGCLP